VPVRAVLALTGSGIGEVWHDTTASAPRRIAECLARVEDQVAVGSRTPAAAAQSLLATFLGKS
jgi:hypothetical protein